jgi:hypothetical protein
LKRGTVLPVARDEQGNLTPAVPQAVIDFLKAVSLPGHVVRGGQYTPQDVREMAANVGLLGSVATKPAGALASGLARNAAELPMDEASRMARADAMFPIEAYHGTPIFDAENGRPGLGDFREFDRLAASKSTGRPPGMTGVGNWFAETPDRVTGAGVYTGGGAHGAIYPVRLSLKNPWRPASYDDFLDELANAAVGVKAAKKLEMWQKARTDPTSLRDKLRRMGYDGIEFAPGSVDGLTGSVRVTLDPNQVRSRFAAFDPAKKDSADLLAGVAGLPGVASFLDGVNKDSRKRGISKVTK